MWSWGQRAAYWIQGPPLLAGSKVEGERRSPPLPQRGFWAFVVRLLRLFRRRVFFQGIVALEAFAHLCAATGGADCGKCSSAATAVFATWTKEGLEQDPKPHYKIAYNFPNSYSIKYNIVWQKLLNYSGPFPTPRPRTTSVTPVRTVRRWIRATRTSSSTGLHGALRWQTTMPTYTR